MNPVCDFCPILNDGENACEDKCKADKSLWKSGEGRYYEVSSMTISKGQPMAPVGQAASH